MSLVINVIKEDNLKQIIVVLKEKVKKSETKSKEICLEWFGHLFTHYSEKILIDDNEILFSIIKSIDQKENKLTELIISLICKISLKNQLFLNQSIK